MLTLSDFDRLDTIPKPKSGGDRYRDLRSHVPPGKSGTWEVEKFTIETGLGLLRMMRDGRGTPPGEYTGLYRNGKVIMSDTDAEIGDLRRLREASGRVLIHGLGLGVALKLVLLRPEVTSVDVVEQSPDVIKLVAPHFVDDRLMIHEGDCLTFKWPRGTRWNVVWHDIWDDICADNKAQMRTLKRKFSRRCNWQHCWAEEWIRD